MTKKTSKFSDVTDQPIIQLINQPINQSSSQNRVQNCYLQPQHTQQYSLYTTRTNNYHVITSQVKGKNMAAAAADDDDNNIATVADTERYYNNAAAAATTTMMTTTTPTSPPLIKRSPTFCSCII